MKKNLMILAVAALTALVSCTDKKTTQSVADTDSTNVAGYTASEDDNLDIQYEVGTDIAHGFYRKSQYAGVVEDTAPAQDSEQNTQAEQTDCIWKRAFAQQIFQYGPGHQTNDDEEQRGKQFCFHVSAFIYLEWKRRCREAPSFPVLNIMSD